MSFSYRLRVAYDGTLYHGWQIQSAVPTVAGTLEKMFERTFKRPVHIIGASRTDIGVHAYGQVARCRTDLEINPQTLTTIWNRSLPSDISIKISELVESSFHPQAQVENKIYYYHLFTQRPLPFYGRYGLQLSQAVCWRTLEHCLDMAIGTHDFRSFCTGTHYTSTVRTITSITLLALPRYKAYRIIIQGPSFLYRMIRRIVGAALHVSMNKKLSKQTYQDIFHACNPSHSLPTAPAHGLLLRKIIYKEPLLFNEMNTEDCYE